MRPVACPVAPERGHLNHERFLAAKLADKFTQIIISIIMSKSALMINDPARACRSRAYAEALTTTAAAAASGR